MRLTSTIGVALALGLFASSALGGGSEPGARGVSAGEAAAWQPDIRTARRYANRRAGEVGFSVVDMEKRLSHYRGGNRARMASTFKVMLMVAYLRQRGVRRRALTQSERALIKPMIRSSNNEAATRIRDMLGRGPIERLARRAGMRDFEWNSIWGYCRTTANDQSRFMRELRRYLPERHWGFASKQLREIRTSQRWGIGQVKPRGWDLLFKGGWGSGSGAVDHQVAQLRRGERRIGVAIITEDNPSHNYGKQTLEGVARRLLRDLPR